MINNSHKAQRFDKRISYLIELFKTKVPLIPKKYKKTERLEWRNFEDRPRWRDRA